MSPADVLAEARTVARERYDAVAAAASHALVALDFDGTLSPIVDDPAQAVIHPEGGEALDDVAAAVRAVAIVTGRPAGQVVELGRLESVADALAPGGRLLVRGQYGNERWDAADRRVVRPEPPSGIARLREELPGLLDDAGADGARLEDKGIALAVHTRGLAEPTDAAARLEAPLAEAAARHGLVVEPGRMVLEVRAPGMHKGEALRGLVEETGARAVLYVGDDLGDIEAFEAARGLREEGLPVLLVCSGSTEEQALADIADLVVDGPGGVVALLHRLARDAG